MKVVIIEDEPRAAQRLRKLLLEIDRETDVLAEIDSVAGAVEWFRDNDKPDLVFMDIHLSDGSGFEIFDKAELRSPVVFTTAYDQYALKAFEVNSIDYLLKPIDIPDLERSVSKFKTLHFKPEEIDYSAISKLLNREKTAYKTRFLVSKGASLIPVHASEIAYFFTHEGIVYLITTSGERYMVNFNLEELEKILDPEYFFRLNRQFIAHLTSIRKVHNYFNSKLKIDLKPVPEVDVIVSRLKATDFKRWMGE